MSRSVEYMVTKGNNSCSSLESNPDRQVTLQTEVSQFVVLYEGGKSITATLPLSQHRIIEVQCSADHSVEITVV